MKIVISNLSIYVLFILSLLSGCSDEVYRNDGAGEVVRSNMAVRIDTKSLVGEDRIQCVRILAFDAGGNLVHNEANVNRLDDAYLFRNVLSTSVRFYAVCNETQAMKDELDGVENVRSLESLRISYPDGVAAPFILCGNVSGVTLKKQEGGDNLYKMSYMNAEGEWLADQSSLLIPLKRLAVKVSLVFIKNEEAESFAISNLSVTIRKIPKYSFLGEGRAYQESVFAPELTLEASAGDVLQNTATYTLNQQTGDYEVSGGDCIVLNDFYIPEHILENPVEDKYLATCVEVRATATYNNIRRPVFYNFELESEEDGYGFQNPRNTWYKVYATIRDLGETGIYARVIPMNIYKLNVGWQPLDGLVIVSDKAEDYGKNRNPWYDINTYSGILKVNKRMLSGERVYTDVVFKYGSVVAIKAAGEVGSEYRRPLSSGSDEDSGSDILWTPGLRVATNTWSQIPYVDGGQNVSENTAIEVQNGRGDPCKLVGLTKEQIEQGIVDNKQWHMASAEEMSWLIDENDRAYDPDAVMSPNGYMTFHTYLIPNTWHRDDNGILRNDQSKGYYWASTGANLFSHRASGTKEAGDNRAEMSASLSSAAYSVRCIRNTIPPTVLSSSNFSSRYNDQGERPASLTTNVPFWKAELITDGEGKGTGEMADFNFARRTSVNSDANSEYITYGVMRKHSTSNNQSAFYYQLKFYDMWNNNRLYNVRLWGRGLDGVERSVIIPITQRGYAWAVTSPNNLGVPSGSSGGMIPKQGGDYKAEICIYTTDNAGSTPYRDVPIPDGVKIWIEVYYPTADPSDRIAISEQYDYIETDFDYDRRYRPNVVKLEIPFTIPENFTGDHRQLIVKAVSNSNLLGKPELRLDKTAPVQEAAGRK